MRRVMVGMVLLGALLLLGQGRSLFGNASQEEQLRPGETQTQAAQDNGSSSSSDSQSPALEDADSAHGTDAEHGEGHGSPVTPVLLALIVIIVAARMGAALAVRFGQPAVLGELLLGMVLGNLALVGFHGLEFIPSNEGVIILAELGVILLLFEVGLESNVREMLSVGPSSLVVAILGVTVPFFIGWGLSRWFLSEYDPLVHLFVGATLCATSVGITARVLSDLGKISARESKIILGAAVIDDVLGLVILAVVSGVIRAANTGGEIAALEIAAIMGKAFLFLIGAVLVGGWISPRLFSIANRLRLQGMLLVVSICFCFALAYVAKLVGLEPIVGAFAAGLVLDEVHYRDYLSAGDHTLEDLLHPLTALLVPVFFVRIGMMVDLSTLGAVEVLVFATVLSVGAVLSKMICGLGVLESGLDRLSVAVGMVPRGEVGLIFANIGATALILNGTPVIDSAVLSAVVIMVMVTTLMTPPALKITLARGDRKKRQALDEATEEGRAAG